MASMRCSRSHVPRSSSVAPHRRRQQRRTITAMAAAAAVMARHTNVPQVAVWRTSIISSNCSCSNSISNNCNSISNNCNSSSNIIITILAPASIPTAAAARWRCLAALLPMWLRPQHSPSSSSSSNLTMRSCTATAAAVAVAVVAAAATLAPLYICPDWVVYPAQVVVAVSLCCSSNSRRQWSMRLGWRTTTKWSHCVDSAPRSNVRLPGCGECGVGLAAGRRLV